MGKEYNTLAFSGGSIRGIAYIGVFKKIEELLGANIDWSI